jgi:hypothetical protein
MLDKVTKKVQSKSQVHRRSLFTAAPNFLGRDLKYGFLLIDM